MYTAYSIYTRQAVSNAIASLDFQARSQRRYIMQPLAKSTLTDEQKMSIVLAYEKCKNIAAVARHFKVNEKTAGRWIRRYKETNTTAVRPGKGRKHALSMESTRQALEMLKSGNFAGAGQVAMELQKLGCTPGSKPLHKSTIIRNATRLASDDGHPIYAARGKLHARSFRRTRSRSGCNSARRT